MNTRNWEREIDIDIDYIYIYHWIFNITSIKQVSNIFLFCNPERQHYIKIFVGTFFCNGPAAFRNGILSRIIGQSRAWIIGSESWKRSIAQKISDGVGVDGVGAKSLFLQVLAVFPVAKDWGTIDSNCPEKNEESKRKVPQKKYTHKQNANTTEKGKTENSLQPH